jgi:riboflavin biosynthesis pyrimidine reductase
MKSRRIIIRHPSKQEPVLWVIDSEQWPRACLRAELIERGYDPYGFITISDALDSLSGRGWAKPEAIILELREQNLTNELVEAIRNLRIPTVVLGGGPELIDPLIKNKKWEVVLKRPVTLGKIADVVQQIVSKHRMAAKPVAIT